MTVWPRRRSRAALKDVIRRQLAKNGDLRRQVASLTAALEEERQWRLRSLPTLLAAEARAAIIPRQFPELGLVGDGSLSRSQVKRHAVLADAYHQSADGQRT